MVVRRDGWSLRIWIDIAVAELRVDVLRVVPLEREALDLPRSHPELRPLPGHEARQDEVKNALGELSRNLFSPGAAERGRLRVEFELDGQRHVRAVASAGLDGDRLQQEREDHFHPL